MLGIDNPIMYVEMRKHTECLGYINKQAHSTIRHHPTKRTWRGREEEIPSLLEPLLDLNFYTMINAGGAAKARHNCVMMVASSWLALLACFPIVFDFSNWNAYVRLRVLHKFLAPGFSLREIGYIYWDWSFPLMRPSAAYHSGEIHLFTEFFHHTCSTAVP